MKAATILRKSLRILSERDGAPSTPLQPSEGEVWETRDRAHQVLVVLKDPLRRDNDYPITGIVILPEAGSGKFSLGQGVAYPRFTTSGKFVHGTSVAHDLDLIHRMSVGEG